MRRFKVDRLTHLKNCLEEGSIVCLFSFDELSMRSKVKVVHDYNERDSNSCVQEGIEHTDYTLEEVREVCNENEYLFLASGEEVYYDYLEEVKA